MRTAQIDICGKTYLLCFSARVIRAVTERYGSVERIDAALSGRLRQGGEAPEDAEGPTADTAPQFDVAEVLDEAVWLLAAMMDGGARYAKHSGLSNPPALTADELLDVIDLDDFSRLREKIAETITNGKETHVEAEPPKNAETTPAAP